MRAVRTSCEPTEIDQGGGLKAGRLEYISHHIDVNVGGAQYGRFVDVSVLKKGEKKGKKEGGAQEGWYYSWRRWKPPIPALVGNFAVNWSLQYLSS